MSLLRRSFLVAEPGRLFSPSLEHFLTVATYVGHCCSGKDSSFSSSFTDFTKPVRAASMSRLSCCITLESDTHGVRISTKYLAFVHCL